MKIVVVSPHRDDAAFSVGLAVAEWLGAGHRVVVLDCFTRSDYAPFADAASLHPNDRASYVTAVRKRENESWQKLYGTSRLHLMDLGIKDAPLRLRCTPDDVCGRPVNPADKAIPKIGKALATLAADALVLPLAVGRHVDHVTAREASLAAVTWAKPCSFYEDLPYTARPGATSELQPIVERVTELTGGSLSPSFACGPADVEAAIKRKRQLALCYDSQIDGEVTDLIAGFSASYEGRERLWGNDAWLASSLAVQTT